MLCVQNSIKAFSQDTTKIYVNTANGDDLSNDGYSTSSPLKTINKAIQKADPGETIIVAAGSYDEQITPAKNGKPDSLITFLADTAGQYFSGYVGHVTINGNLSNDYGFNLTDRSYISIIGFTFQYHRQQPIFINAQTSNITNINIQNCKFSYWGQNTMADSSAILIYSNSGYSIKNHYCPR